MNIVIFIPYFGKLPQYFEAFCNSSAMEGVKFKVFTDDTTISSIALPQNFSYEIWTFEKMQSLVENRVSAKLFSPYKLCDYKPLYGILFKEYLEECSYWGHCDIDVIMGDIVGWLDSIDYTKYDRVGRYGHFTLYKSDFYHNSLPLQKIDEAPLIARWDFVKKTAYPCNFDEIGMNIIYRNRGLKFYEDIPFLGSTIDFKHLHSVLFRDKDQVWIRENNKVYSLTYDNNNNVHRTEYAYMHFMLFNPKLVTSWTNKMCVTAEEIFSCDDMSDWEIIKKYCRPDTAEEHKTASRFNDKRLRKKSIKKFKDEFRHCGLYAFVNLFKRVACFIDNKFNRRHV